MALIPARKLVFLDETGCNVTLSRLRGWAPSGVRAEAFRPVNRGKNVTVTGAIRLTGQVCLKTLVGAMNKERFVDFVRQCLAPRLEVDDVVVMDNLRAHYADEAIEAIESRGAHVLFLPPYSPDLNPIELLWAALKRHIRRTAARELGSLRNAIRAAWRRTRRLQLANLFRACGYHQGK